MPSEKKILIITYYWPPSGGAGVQRWLKFARYLPEYGWEPVILTVDPNHAEYPVIDTDLLKDIPPGLRVVHTKAPGNIFRLYKKITGRKELPSGGFSNDSKPGITDKISRFIRGNFFLPDPRRNWNKHLLKKAREIIRSEEIKIVLTSSPPHSTQLAGMKLKEENEIRWIADIRDPWIDIYYSDKLYQTSRALAVNKKLEAAVLADADRVLVTCNATGELFSSKLPGQQVRNKITTLTNGYDDRDFPDNDVETPPVFTITYLGSFAENYNIDVLLESIEKQDSASPSEISLRFIGSISRSSLEKLKNLSDISFEFIPYLNHDKAIKALVESSALLLVVPANRRSQEMIPGKLFEYIAARRPIIALGPKTGDVAEILKQTKSGKTFERNDSALLSDYLGELLENYHKGELTVKSTGIAKYSRNKLTSKLADILEEELKQADKGSIS